MLTFIRRTLFVLVGLVGLYLVATPFVVPWFAKQKATEIFAVKVNGALIIEDMSFNPFSLRTEVTGLAIDDGAGAPVVRLPKLVLDAGWDSALGGDIFVDEVVLTRSQVNLTLFEDGSNSLTKMIKPAPAATDEDSSPVPTINIAHFAIEDAGLGLTNESGRNVAVGPINITLNDISTAPDQIANLNQFVVELGGGRVSLAGSMKPEPLELDVQLNFEQLPLDGIASLYLKDQLTLESGSVGGAVAVVLGQTSSISGSVDLDQLSLKTPQTLRTLEVPYAELKGFNSDLAFEKVSIEQILIETPSMAVENSPADKPEGVVDETATVAAERTSHVVDEQDSGPMRTITVDQFTLNGGTIDVTDASIANSAPITFSNTNIDISDFAFGDVLKANFDIAAMVANESPLKVTGNLVSADKLTAKIDVTLDKLGYNVLAPYSAQAIGRGVDDGSFYLDLDYTITENTLESENILLFDRWKWGQSVEGFEGTSVPVDLAFALLQDSNNRVELDVPVHGDLDDPEFRFGRVVFRAFTNVIVKLVASPFKLLGALIPGGNSDLDLSKVKFVPSAAEIEPIEKAKIDALAKALAERPALKLEITGVAAANRDMQPAPEVETPPASESGEQVAEPTPAPLDAEGLRALATARAELVHQMLIDSGVVADRLVIKAPSIDKPAKGRSVSVILDVIK